MVVFVFAASFFMWNCIKSCYVTNVFNEQVLAVGLVLNVKVMALDSILYPWLNLCYF